MNIQEVLGPDGLLASSLPGFACREQQIKMAEAIADVIQTNDVLVAEAGTGTGKTFAYLLPALLSGLKVIISTGTKNLQDQLYLRDLPRMCDLLASPAKTALLKGRANYLCVHRLDNALHDVRGQPKDIVKQLVKVRDWEVHSNRGDKAELVDIPEDSAIWPLITSTNENCLGQECPQFQKCYLVEARRDAQEADVLVINHHLLCADFSIKDGGFGELLPAADVFIIDEAHQLPDVASNFFGLTVTTRQLTELAGDAVTEYHREAGDQPKLIDKADKLKKLAQDLRLTFPFYEQRGAWQEIEENTDQKQAIDDLRLALGELREMLEKLSARGKGLAACFERTEQLLLAYDHITDVKNNSDDIHWYETWQKSLRMHSTPIDISNLFRSQMEQYPVSWIFTSATLAVGDSFEHFTRQLGLAHAQTAKWDSPFDYQKQALWYVPKGLPQPNANEYTEAVMAHVLPIVEASQGRAFLLFTSHRALKQAAAWLEDRVSYKLLVQGAAPKTELIEQFVEDGHAILMGTASFWEGVDVRGEALSLVVIDKLPFASPGDPVLQARLESLRKQGVNPFMDYQVPQAAIALKQGAGRLIRDVTDRGVLVLCDPRLLKKSYGHQFLAAMPDFARTRELDEAVKFFNA